MASTTVPPAESVALAIPPLVLMYHSVAPYDEDPYQVTMTPERFERQMRWLRRRGFRGVSMRELLSARAGGRARGLVGLTFDDGYEDFATYALPILLRFDFTATVFVLAGRLGGENAWSIPGPVKPLLTSERVREIAAAGMEIGSHGLLHIRLPDADDRVLKEETMRSRVILEEIVGHVHGFCYPWGDVDGRTVEAVRAAGYDYACMVRPSFGFSRHTIPRTYVHEGDSAWRLDAKRVLSRLTIRNRFAALRHRGDG